MHLLATDSCEGAVFLTIIVARQVGKGIKYDKCPSKERKKVLPSGLRSPKAKCTEPSKSAIPCMQSACFFNKAKFFEFRVFLKTSIWPSWCWSGCRVLERVRLIPWQKPFIYPVSLSLHCTRCIILTSIFSRFSMLYTEGETESFVIRFGEAMSEINIDRVFCVALFREVGKPIWWISLISLGADGSSSWNCLCLLCSYIRS